MSDDIQIRPDWQGNMTTYKAQKAVRLFLEKQTKDKYKRCPHCDLIECITERLKLSMKGLSTETVDNIGTCTIDFSVHSADELQFVMKSIKEIEGVDEISIQQKQ